MTRRPTNRLAAEASPYLRQHMYNPVDWYPWGEEALAKARAEEKPILLSVGYAACHWCHVMERDAFAVEEIAEKLNRDFVSIKVDREERPDIDQLYQGVVQLMGRGGGWPLTVFLTPDLHPFFGGTYFPPRDAHGQPGFSRLIDSIANAWEHRREEVQDNAASFDEGLGRYVRMGIGVGEEEPDEEDLERVASAIAGALDPMNGGFFGAPKFPHPMELSFMLRMAASPPAGEGAQDRRGAEHVVRLSLDRMAHGGIYDQLGGGFHRYSVDERWLVPHFEKMLTDNAQLLRLYAEAAVAFGDEAYARIARETAAWLARELSDPRGAFYSSQDADSEGVEGKYYVWTPHELREVLGDELAKLAMDHFGVSEEGSFEGGASVLRLPASASPLLKERGDHAPLLEEETRLGEVRRLLFEARQGRAAPTIDDKVIAGWNGVAIGGLAAAGRLLGDEALVERARRAAAFVLSELRTPEGLFRLWREGELKQDAFLDDWAGLCEGLLELFEASGERRWLEEAERLADGILERFWDEDDAVFYLTRADRAGLGHRVAAVHDSALPSGGSSAAVSFLRLHVLTGEDRFGRVASRYLRKQRDELLRNPFAFGHLLVAAYLQVRGITEVAVLGREGALRSSLLEAARRGFHPEILAYASTQGDGPLLAGRGEVDGKPAAWICRRYACEAPRGKPEEVAHALGL